jgi:hypothetical protein
VCSKCNFEKIYFLGVGFLNKREVKLFECKDCEAIKKSVISKPKCSKCNKKSINEIIDFNTKLKSLMFMLSPLEEQKAIVEKVNTLMSLCDRLGQELKQSQQHSEQLMQSCLREVFEGGKTK